MSQRIQVRRGTAAQWTAANPTLAAGEFGLDTDSGRVKIGDGAALWSALPYLGQTTQVTELTQLRKSSDQTLPSFAYTAIAWQTEDYDTLSLHDPATNPTRVTASRAGVYEFSGMVVIDAGTGPFYLQYHKNGTAYPGRKYEQAPANGVTDIALTRLIAMNVGDYVELKVDNESGANRTIRASLFSGEAQTMMTVRWVGPLPV